MSTFEPVRLTSTKTLPLLGVIVMYYVLCSQGFVLKIN